MRNVFFKEEKLTFFTDIIPAHKKQKPLTIYIYVLYTELCFGGKFSLTPCPTALQFS
jgi:hypothetical protein